MHVGARTITGRRKHNEDALLVAPEFGVYAVADGMGDYEGGEVASELTVRTPREFFRLIARTDGNVSAAAREAKMDRKYLAELLDRYGLR